MSTAMPHIMHSAVKHNGTVESRSEHLNMSNLLFAQCLVGRIVQSDPVSVKASG
jgi:hypothetical protein